MTKDLGVGKSKYLISKGLSFVIIIILSVITGSLYGILHDQLTYSISEEYYTKFKFIQFGLASEEYQYSIYKPRVLVIITGIIATWWVGLIFGISLGVLTFIKCLSWKLMFQSFFKTLLIVLFITTLIGLLGLAYGFLFFNDSFFLNQFQNIEFKRNFYAVGTMHNFSYFGGLLGLLVGIFFQLKSKRNQSTIDN